MRRSEKRSPTIFPRYFFIMKSIRICVLQSLKDMLYCIHKQQRVAEHLRKELMMEDYAVYDAQRCTLEVSVIQTFCGKQTTLPGSTHLFYNVAFIAAFKEHNQEECLVLQTLSQLFYGSSSKYFTYCEVYQVGDGEYLLVVGEDLQNVDQDMTMCRVYDAPERVVKYLKSL